MSGGGKGGRSTTSVEIPEWLEIPARRNIARAEEIARIGYVPYYGPDVAAMTPMQLAAGGNIGSAASAFGLGTPMSPTAGMPEATNYNGMMAYSSAPLYEQSLAMLQDRAPGQYAALRAPFIDPITGAQPAEPFNSSYDPIAAAQPVVAPVVPMNQGEHSGGFRRDNDGFNGVGNNFASTVGSYLPGGVNTRNPSSPFNKAAANIRNTLQGNKQPTIFDVPIQNPRRSSGGSSSQGRGK